MLPVVLNRIAGFNRSFEGYIHHMYRDVRGFVTVGVGNLLPSSAAAAALPFTHGLNGGAAGPGEAAAAWNKVNAAPAGRPVSDTGDTYSALTDLRLPDAAIDALVLTTAGLFDGANLAEFPQYPNFPADAQLGLISMRWPGAWNTFPTFREHVAKGRWCGAARECYFNESGNPGLKPRNLANRWLFGLAARATGMGLEPGTIYYDKAGAGANKLFLFRGGQYVRYDWNADKVDEGYPASNSGWRLPSPFSEGVDAAVDGLGAYKVPKFYGKTYFFRGDKYVRYDWDTDRIDYGPRPLTEWGLTGEFAGGIDAAVNGRGKFYGKLYFFKGDRYVRYDWANEKIDQAEATIAAGWKLPEPFASGVEAAVNGEGDFHKNLYFFKGDQYIRCVWKPEYAVDGQPTPISPAWGGLGEKGFGANIRAALNAPGCLPSMQQG